MDNEHLINDFSQLSAEQSREAQVRSDEVYRGEREDTTVESVQGMQH